VGSNNILCNILEEAGDHFVMAYRGYAQWRIYYFLRRGGGAQTISRVRREFQRGAKLTKYSKLIVIRRTCQTESTI